MSATSLYAEIRARNPRKTQGGNSLCGPRSVRCIAYRARTANHTPHLIVQVGGAALVEAGLTRDDYVDCLVDLDAKTCRIVAAEPPVRGWKLAHPHKRNRAGNLSFRINDASAIGLFVPEGQREKSFAVESSSATQGIRFQL